MFLAAVDAVQPASLLRRVDMVPEGVVFGSVALCPARRFVLVCLGKAAPGLAAAFLARTARRPDEVFVLTTDGVAVADPVRPFVRRGGHPFPDSRGEAATDELLALLGRLHRDDGVLMLLSGGASSLLAAPLPGLGRDDVVAVTRALMHAGAPIGELNVVRKHLLAAAGGRLAAACPAPLLALVVSDVPGDDLALIASGPTVTDPSSRDDALAILARRGLADTFEHVTAFLRSSPAAESVKPGDRRLAGTTTSLLGSSADALAAAAAVASQAGFRPVVLTRVVRGEARAVGPALAAAGCATLAHGPVALLAAGETTVVVTGSGQGGRNLELALAAALQLVGTEGVCLLAGATDGVDGSSPAAGAVVDGRTIARGVRRGRDALACLAANDSWGFFHGAEEAILTGPTGTNVADLVFVLSAGGVRRPLPLALGESARLAPPPW